MNALQGSRFDLIFADAWAGKFWDFRKAVDLLNKGGIYVIDDLLPAPPWPPDHAAESGHVAGTGSEASGLDVLPAVLVHGAGGGRQRLGSEIKDGPFLPLPRSKAETPWVRRLPTNILLSRSSISSAPTNSPDRRRDKTS